MTTGFRYSPCPRPNGTLSDQNPFATIECISGNTFRDLLNTPDFRNLVHNYDTLPAYGGLSSDAHLSTPYEEWTASLPKRLNPVAQNVVKSWWSFGLLKDVFNCGAAHTKTFGPEVYHTRRDHCIHAAVVARELAERTLLISLTEHEKTVLELVMLLHDPHRLGSHALDRVIASIPGAPPIHSWGWGHDFHEYHGAQQVFRDRQLKAILGEYWPDVLAVLSFPDKRDPNDPTRIKDFGPPPSPEAEGKLLSRDRIGLLYVLKDEVDRMSYLELDYRRSGFEPFLVRGLLACIQHYQDHLITVGSNLANLIPTKGPLRHLDAPFDPWIAARQLHREHIATHPVACLVDAVLREALMNVAAPGFKGNLDSTGYYQFVRNIALEGSYHKLFGSSVLEVLFAPRAHPSTLGLEDIYAPLLTVTRDDLLNGSGANPLNQIVSPEKSKEACGAHRADMTRLEYDLRTFLRAQGLDSNVFVILSNDFEKDFSFTCVNQPTDVARPDFIQELRNSNDYTGSRSMFDVVRLATRSSPRAEQLIIAVKALDDSGQCRDLKPIQRAVNIFFREHNLLKDPNIPETSFRPRAFCEPLDPLLFRPEVRSRMVNYQPAWIERGGCGLVS